MKYNDQERLWYKIKCKSQAGVRPWRTYIIGCVKILVTFKNPIGNYWKILKQGSINICTILFKVVG